jgi:WhiB family redox-sensing transcriptional regulator
VTAIALGHDDLDAELAVFGAGKNSKLDSWMDLAACRGRTAMFYAEDAFSERLAVAVCARCPVRAECLADAVAVELVTGIIHGVRAGFTQAERRAQVVIRSQLPSGR